MDWDDTEEIQYLYQIRYCKVFIAVWKDNNELGYFCTFETLRTKLFRDDITAVNEAKRIIDCPSEDKS